VPRVEGIVLKRRFGWEWNGMPLHEMQFANLTRKRANLEKAAGLGTQISRDFGSHA
jgi:Fe-Mn family superoxide dismutase